MIGLVLAQLNLVKVQVVKVFGRDLDLNLNFNQGTLRTLAKTLVLGLIGLSCVAATTLFFSGLGNSTTLMVVGNLGITCNFTTNAMVLVVTLISSIVILFSIEYMASFEVVLFLAYLALFQFAMVGFVLTHNWIFLFFSWELMGLASYLLINF